MLLSYFKHKEHLYLELIIFNFIIIFSDKN